MFGSTEVNFQVMFMFYIIPLIIGVTLMMKKKYLLGIFVLSFFANVIFYFDAGASFYRTNDLMLLVLFVLNVWPLLNLALLVTIVTRFFQKKYAK